MHTFAVARAVRGIEPLVAAEIRRAGLGVVRGMRHREVWFEPADPGPELLELRMADDVLLVAAVVEGVGRDKEALARLARAAREIDTEILTKRAQQITGSPYGVRDCGVEVSASFVGRRNYSRFDIEDAVGAELARPTGLPYHSRRDGRVPPEGSTAWRVTVEGEQAVIALRVPSRPLHRRSYKTESIPGTLHPPVAAAMAGLARLDRAATVLDPCCGAGTTLIEARALAPHTRLLGLDPHAVHIAAANAARDAGRGIAVRDAALGLAARNVARGIAWGVADAERIPLTGGSVDRVLVNPPWDRQVAPTGRLSRDPARLWREIHRVLAVGGIVVALLPEPWQPPGFRVDRMVHLTLSGRHPVIAVLRRSASRG
ncbi:methyltransferase domain-containing protein [Nonomuraea sp. NPDC026600]|uniref:methyltransferase domain-containing protein n=1 Tax=Nonomuraea sp. NPDC026600 TaxID=3155363 RepID=UPI0033EA1E28